MKKLLFFFTLAVIITFSNCKQNTKSQKEDSSAFDWKNAQTYVSEDGESEFLIIRDTENKDGIVLLEKKSGTIFHLNHVRAASGVKCADEDGFTFWTKGDDFIWSNHMEIIASGKLKNH